MKQVKCINAKNYKLTEGSNYLVEENGEFYKLTNDSGKFVRYAKELFEDIQINIAPPEPVVILPPRTEQDCIESINVVTSISQPNKMITAEVSYHDMDNNLVKYEVSMCYSGSDISCGVYQIRGINDLMATVLSNINFQNHELTNLNKALFKQIIISIFEEFESNCQTAFLLLSTNFDNDFEDYFDILTSLSTKNTEWVANPNSGNNICVWIFEFSE